MGSKISLENSPKGSGCGELYLEKGTKFKYLETAITDINNIGNGK